MLLIVQHWIPTPSLRYPATRRLAWHAQAHWAPVHTRWAWNWDDGQGAAETAFLAWPCSMLHEPGWQCRGGRVFHGNTPEAYRR